VDAAGIGAVGGAGAELGSPTQTVGPAQTGNSTQQGIPAQQAGEAAGDWRAAAGAGVAGAGELGEGEPNADLGAGGGGVHGAGASGHPAPPPSVPRLNSAIQLHNSYLVAESDDGMIIIDQHALHERIMYEDLKARLSRGPLESQHLLIPQTIGASSRQIELLEQIQPLLRRLGIEASAFGPDTVAVQAFPSFMEKLDPSAFVAELLERGEQELLDLHDEELLHGILDMMACKAAVKAGDPLSAAEIEALLARRHLVDRSSNCPHGRPTTLRLSLRDLEKQFKRTGF
jgi:DNA mismatch repair protein MutL